MGIEGFLPSFHVGCNKYRDFHTVGHSFAAGERKSFKQNPFRSRIAHIWRGLTFIQKQISTPAPSQAPKVVQEPKERQPPSPSTQFGTYELLETVPHDQDAFTQGLQLVGGDTLYECVGHYGKSDLRRVDLLTGRVLQRQPLPDDFFGEGITYFEDNSGKGRIVQLTWREKTAFVYDSESFKLLDRFSYNTETGQGWGITWRQKQSTFIVSDGSPFLHTWESDGYAEIKRTEVYTLLHGGKGAARGINELEYDPITDTVLANVWFNEVILRIDPDTGFVKTIYDLRGLYPPEKRSSADNEAVLNGIALVIDKPDQVWVTGKLWSHMFRIRLIEPGEVKPTI